MSTLEQTSFVKLQDIKLSISSAGKGEPVLCLHGSPGNKSIFSNLMTKLEGLNIKLLSVDRLGHNGVDDLPNEKNDPWYDTSVYADLIDNKLDKKAWILGYDYGCLTALKIAIKHPEKVKGLIFINPYIMLNNPNQGCSSVPYYAKGPLTGSILGIWLPYEYFTIFGDLIKKLFAPETPSEDYFDTWIQRFTRFENIISYLTDQNLQILIQDELKEELKKFSLPVFTLLGGKDAFADNKQQQELLSTIPNIKVETSENSGHYMPYLNPDICIDFIKKSITG